MSRTEGTCTPQLSVEASQSLAPQGEREGGSPCAKTMWRGGAAALPTNFLADQHLPPLLACMQCLRIRFCPRLSPTHEPNNLCRSTEIVNVFHPALIQPTLRICMYLQKTIFSINKLCTLDSVILPTIRFCDNKKSAVIQLVDFFFRNYYAPDPCLLSQDRALQMKLPLRPFVRVLGS